MRSHVVGLVLMGREGLPPVVLHLVLLRGLQQVLLSSASEGD